MKLQDNKIHQILVTVDQQMMNLFIILSCFIFINLIRAKIKKYLNNKKPNLSDLIEVPK